MTTLAPGGSETEAGRREFAPPRLDPELAAALAAIGEIGPSEPPSDLVQYIRAMHLLVPSATNEELRRDGAFEVLERLVPGPPGAPQVPLVICRPTNAPTPTPAVYYIHGGGLVAGDSRLGLAGFLERAEEVGAAVISPEYRRPPETPHPGPVEDCYAGLAWIAANAAELGVDPLRIVVAGGSAGGGLSAAVALLARDRGGPALAGQMLWCPMLDDRNDTPSTWQMAGVDLWDRIFNGAGWRALLGEACGGPDVSPYASPARATDLSGLPPAFIDVGSAETLRDEAVAYAEQIWLSGGLAELHVWPGAFHGYAAVAPQAAITQDSDTAPRKWLRRILST